MFIGIICLCVFAYLKWIKGKTLFKKKYTDYQNYKMVIKNYHFKRENNMPSHIIYLKDFKSSNLKITKINCADRRVCHIDYFKNNNTMPLYLKMLDFYGYVEIINNKRILKIVKINLNDNF